MPAKPHKKPVIHPELFVDPKVLKPFPANTNTHPDRNREAIRSSLTAFDQVEALTVWGKNTDTGKAMDEVLGGNGRLDVIRQDLKWPKVLIKRVDCSPQQARAINVALNRTNRLSKTDPKAEADALEELRDDPILLEAAGYTEDEADDVLEELQDDEEDEPAAPVEGDARIECPECGHKFRVGKKTKVPK